MDKNETLAIELTKLVVAAKPTPTGPGVDVFRICADYLSVYRYLLKDLREHR